MGTVCRVRRKLLNPEERKTALAELKRFRKKYGRHEKGWDTVEVLRRVRYGE